MDDYYNVMGNFLEPSDSIVALYWVLFLVDNFAWISSWAIAFGYFSDSCSDYYATTVDLPPFASLLPCTFLAGSSLLLNSPSDPSLESLEVRFLGDPFFSGYAHFFVFCIGFFALDFV